MTYNPFDDFLWRCYFAIQIADVLASVLVKCLKWYIYGHA